MKNKIFVFLVLLFWLFLVNINSKNLIKFEHITQKHGLSQHIVYSIIQDKFGFLWFGTRNGLNKYDGYKFIVYTHKKNKQNSLSNNVIRSICTDNSGNLWIGTWGGGINKFDIETEQFTSFIHNPKNKNSLSDNFILKLYMDSQNRLWILSKKGLEKFNIESQQFHNFRHNPQIYKSISSNTVYSILEDNYKTIWIGTSNGLNEFKNDKIGFRQYKVKSQHLNSNVDNHIYSLFKDNLNRLWIGNKKGAIYIFSIKEKKFKMIDLSINSNIKKLNLGIINCFYQDQFNNIWVGTIFQGMIKINLKKNKLIHYKNDPTDQSSISDNRIKSIYMDNSASLWIGTDTGINKFSPYKTKFNHYRFNQINSGRPIDNRIRSIIEDCNNIIWLGTESGLVRFDRINNKYSRYIPDVLNQKNKKHFLINTMLEDMSKTLWLGSNSGLIGFKKKRRPYIYLSALQQISKIITDKVWAIHEYNKETLLIGTKNGLIKFNKKTGKTSPFFQNIKDSCTVYSRFVHIIYRDSFGKIWLGTDSGVDRYDITENHFKHYQHNPQKKESLSNNNIWTIYEDKDKTLWVGTLEGLNKYNRNDDHFILIVGKPDFSNRAIYGILGDEKNNLWISTDNGLFKFNTKTESSDKYDINDGLQNNEFGLGSCFKNNQGEMFFAGSNGFNAFFPDKVIDNPYIPQIVITDFKIHGQSIKAGEKSFLKRTISATKSIILSYKENNISFEFAALDFTITSKNQYSFILEGFDKKWNFVGTDRQATYTNLSYGNYIFRVKGSNNDKIWNNKGVELKINITPPFWFTWWFKAFIFTVLIFIILGLYLIRINSIKKRILLKEKSKQLVIAQKMKLVGLLAAGATHDLSNLLFTIISYSRKLESENINSKEVIKISKVKSAAEKAIQIVKQITAFSRPNNIRHTSQDLSILIDDIINILKELIPYNIVVKWKPEKKKFLFVIDPIKFQQIILNLILNAVEAMPDGGELRISMKKNKTDISVIIQDTGYGIDETNIKKIFTPQFTTKLKENGSGLGLFVVNQIVNEYNGQIEVKSSIGKGTIFKIYFPL